MKSSQQEKSAKRKSKKESKNTTTSQKTNSRPKPAALSNVFCPEGMSLEAWQRGLRAQEAAKSPMAIEMVDAELSPGEFSVMSHSHHYKVVYHGVESEWNFCSCMDFKTNGLGTCKHLEGVKLYLQAERLPSEFPLPAYSSIYLTYQPERVVKLRLGDTNREAMAKLAAKFFKKDYSLRKGSESTLDTFVRRAKELDPAFRIYPDAVDFLTEARDRAVREAILERYDDTALNSLVRSVQLYPYQREGIRFAFKRGKSIIADEMGLGKTIQAIATAELLRREYLVDSVLIMCPTSLKYQWKKEIERFAGASVLVVEGDPLMRARAYRNASAPYKIVSYNAIANDLKVYKTMDCDLLIMDEVQRLKNWNTKIAQAARLIHSNYAVVLSGTPLENKLDELYSIMQLVDQFCLGPLYLFRNRTMVTDGETGKTVGYKNLNMVGQQISSVLLRRTKKQVELQMPLRSDKILYVGMTPQQQEVHDECQNIVARVIQKWRQYHFLSEQDRQKMLLNMSKMRMACDSTFILDQKTFYHTKIEEAVNIIKETIENGDEKLVVFSQWERMTRLLTMELDQLGVRYEYLHGGVPSEKRKVLMDNFTTDPDSRVFISTDAGSTGLNLQVASILINFDLPWNPAVLEQRIARIFRLGQQRNIQVINMVAHDTIEERMLATLNFKSGMFAGILDDGEDAIFLENSKLEKIIETFSGVAHASETAPAPPAVLATPVNDDVVPTPDAKPDVEQPTAVPAPPVVEPTTPVTPGEVINQGFNFLKNLSDVLCDEQKTQDLVNSIVKTDANTGETAIHIPVDNKESVAKVLSVFGKLFSAK